MKKFLSLCHLKTWQTFLVATVVFSLIIFTLNYLTFVRNPQFKQNIHLIKETNISKGMSLGKNLDKDDHIMIAIKHPEFVVPNIVHYIWFGSNHPLKFHQMLAMKSAYDFIKPDVIYLHCDNEPVGKWWDFIKSTIQTLKVVYRKPRSEIFGNEVILAEHKSDIARIEILLDQGGIYLDFDILVLKSFNKLRFYDTTMGIEYRGSPGRLNNGVIIAKPKAEFLQLWLESYWNFTKREWDYHDSIIPYYMQYHYPKLIHVEEKSINYPSGKRLDLIYEKVYNLKDNYALHLWHRLYEFEHNPFDIKKMNTTFGYAARLIYYGNATIID